MTVRPITQAEREPLAQTMEAEGHSCPFASHVFVNDKGEVVGACSVECAPVLFFWMTTRHRHGLACVRALQSAEALFKAMGHSRILLPIERTSPFYPFIERLGFQVMGAVELHIKTIPICAR